MITEELKNLIDKQVDAKAKDLCLWRQVRYEGGRVYYEATKILNEIFAYPLEVQILYLERLHAKNFVLQDYWPREIPDVTVEFKNWISQRVVNLKIKQLSEVDLVNDNLGGSEISTRKKRKSIPNKTRALLQQEIGSLCPFCNGQDVGHFEIHHIDEVPDNNELSNLLMLCPTCHSKVTKGDITVAQVKAYKLNRIQSAE